MGFGLIPTTGHGALDAPGNMLHLISDIATPAGSQPHRHGGGGGGAPNVLNPMQFMNMGKSFMDFKGMLGGGGGAAADAGGAAATAGGVAVDAASAIPIPA